jgi:hypothetical protein
VEEVLGTKNDKPMRDRGIQLLNELGQRAAGRNLAIHTMWVAVGPQREIQPNPSVPRHKKLEDDFKSQFADLTTNLGTLLRELQMYETALFVRLESSRARAQENVAALKSGNGP